MGFFNKSLSIQPAVNGHLVLSAHPAVNGYLTLFRAGEGEGGEEGGCSSYNLAL